MKQLVFDLKEAIQLRLTLIKASIVYTFQIETAYWANNLIGVVGVTGFALANLVLTGAIYGNVNSIAGYSKDEMLLFFMLGNINFFINRSFIFNNISRLIKDVNLGDFDLILIKPVPSLFYSQFKNLSLITFFKEAIPSFIIFSIAIDWQNIHINGFNLLAGIFIIIVGHIGVQFVQFILSLPAFWFGESSNISGLSFVFDYRLGRFIPFEGLALPLRLFFSSAIPVMLSTGLALSVILGKTSIFAGLWLVSFVALGLVIVEVILWRETLKKYTSASS